MQCRSHCNARRVPLMLELSSNHVHPDPGADGRVRGAHAIIMRYTEDYVPVWNVMYCHCTKSNISETGLFADPCVLYRRSPVESALDGSYVLIPIIII